MGTSALERRVEEEPAPGRAREQLVHLLRLAYSGELGATRAYLGHRYSLKDRGERADLGKIIREEIHHRHVLLKMLTELGSGPDPRRERKMNQVGWCISLFSRVAGWFMPMYGAGLLESKNIREYEHAARLALLAGCESYVDLLLELAEVEWDHERYFRRQASRHILWHLFPAWLPPPPRESIRQLYGAFVTGERELQPIRQPLLIR